MFLDPVGNSARRFLTARQARIEQGQQHAPRKALPMTATGIRHVFQVLQQRATMGVVHRADSSLVVNDSEEFYPMDQPYNINDTWLGTRNSQHETALTSCYVLYTLQVWFITGLLASTSRQHPVTNSGEI